MDRTLDVAVVGGGAIGTSTLFHLAADHDVRGILFEKGQLGSGSTGKAAGGVRNTFTSPANIAVGNRAIEYFRNFADRVGEEVPFRQDGYMYLFHSEAAAERWRDRAALFRRHGVGAELLSPAGAAEKFPPLDADAIGGALFGPDCGHVDPHRLTQAFGRAATERGATVHTGTAVTDVRVEDGAVAAVETETGTHEVDAVLNAAGPWAARVAGMVGLDVPLDLLVRRIVVLEGLSDADGPLAIDPERECYFGAEPDGSLLVCNTGEDIHDIEDPDAATDQRVGYDYHLATAETVSELVPALPDLSVRNGWSGLQTHAPDGHAIVGPTAIDGFYLGCGFSGHGVQQSPVVGGALADMMVRGGTDRVDAAAFSPARFEEAAAGRTEEMA